MPRFLRVGLRMGIPREAFDSPPIPPAPRIRPRRKPRTSGGRICRPAWSGPADRPRRTPGRSPRPRFRGRGLRANRTGNRYAWVRFATSDGTRWPPPWSTRPNPPSQQRSPAHRPRNPLPKARQEPKCHPICKTLKGSRLRLERKPHFRGVRRRSEVGVRRPARPLLRRGCRCRTPQSSPNLPVPVSPGCRDGYK